MDIAEIPVNVTFTLDPPSTPHQSSFQFSIKLGTRSSHPKEKKVNDLHSEGQTLDVRVHLLGS